MYLFYRPSLATFAFLLQGYMNKILKLWGINRTILNEKARKIWGDGFRPGRNVEEVVGSGFDTEDSVKD